MQQVKLAKDAKPLICDNEGCEQYDKVQTDYEIRFEDKPYTKLWLASKGQKAWGEVNCYVLAYCKDCEGELGSANMSIDLEAEWEWEDVE